MDILIPVARTVDVGDTWPPVEESGGEEGRDALYTPVAWTVEVGETCPPSEESDGEKDKDVLGKMAAVEVGEGVSERVAEVEATD